MVDGARVALRSGSGGRFASLGSALVWRESWGLRGSVSTPGGGGAMRAEAVLDSNGAGGALA